MARPAAAGEDTGGGGAGDVSRRLPVDARSPGCWADVKDGEVVRSGVSGPRPVDPPTCPRITAIADGDLRCPGTEAAGTAGEGFRE